jgi:two-component system chemotaxis response regulator CheY
VPAKRILSLGQCGADHAAIAWTVRGNLDAEVVPAATAEEALTLLRNEAFDLVLVNRVLDQDGSLGMDFVNKVKADADLKDIPVMLVSNYEDSQEEAVRGGALRGFGKSALRNPQTLDLLRMALTSGKSNEE